MKKKVLIISYSYPPSNAPAAQRPYALTKYLNKNEFQVTVLICGNSDSSLGYNDNFDSHIEDVNLIKIDGYLGQKASKFREATMVGSKSVGNKLKGFLFNFISSLIIPDKGIFWFPKLKKYIDQNIDIEKDFDIVFTTSPSFTNHLMGRYIKNKAGERVKWFAEFRDFHALEKDMKNIKHRINKYLESSVISKADKISFISKSMCHIYALHYKNHDHKFSIVYNGFDLADFAKLPIQEVVNNKLTIFYAGSFYKGVRSPMPLLQILDALLSQDKISLNEIQINIAGNFEEDIIAEAQKYKSFQVIDFIGKISRSEVLERLVRSDLLWLIVGDSPTHYTGVPIKLFEYIGARRPIINFAPANSEPSFIIQQHRLGWNFNTSPFNILEAAEIFENIIENHRNKSLSTPLEFKKINEFDRQYQGEIFGNLFNLM